MRERIAETLRRIETEQGVRVLYAAESGSRAWGFASANSDWDVRFVYARTPRDYLRVTPPRNVIELPITDDLDVSGWDIFKALALFRKSNPPLLEWLRSPIIYHEPGDFAARLRALSEQHYSPRRLTYHYLSLSRNNWEKYIKGRAEVTYKKYLYVLRPFLCIRWIERHGSPPPTSVWDTLEGVELPEEARERLVALLHRKQQAEEMGAGPGDAALNAFIAEEIARILTCVPNLPDDTVPDVLLNALAWRELSV